MSELPLRSLREGVALDLYVQPRAGKNEIIGLQGSELKVRLTSPPVEGAANKLCCEFFAGLLGIAKSNVSIISGDKSRHKKLFIRNMTADEVRCALAGKFPPA